MYSNKKYEEKNFDNYLRIFPRVKAIKGLSLLQVHLICDVISRRVQGEPYYKSSNKLAKEYGRSPKTIQNAFQKLERDGYINTQPYNDGSHDQSLREVEVVDMERYIYSDKYLSEIGFEPKPIVKKDKDAESEWVAVKAKKKKKDGGKSMIKDGGEITSQPKKTMDITESNTIESTNIPLVEVPIIKDETNKKAQAEDNFDVQKYLTPRKIAFAKGLENDTFKVEHLYSCNKEQLDKFFYYEENIWKIKRQEVDGQDLWENIHGINLRHIGGSRLTLFTLDKDEKKTESYQLDMKDFNGYLEKRGIDFGDLTEDNFGTLKQYQKPPLQMYQS